MDIGELPEAHLDPWIRTQYGGKPKGGGKQIGVRERIATAENRTRDLLITSQALYQLSHSGAAPIRTDAPPAALPNNSFPPPPCWQPCGRAISPLPQHTPHKTDLLAHLRGFFPAHNPSTTLHAPLKISFFLHGSHPAFGVRRICSPEQLDTSVLLYHWWHQRIL